MRALGLALLVVTVGCELEGPEDKRRDGETFEQAEAPHAAERQAAAKPDARDIEPTEPLPPGKTVLEARRDGDAVVVDYRGWLACDGNFELRSSGVSGDVLRLVIIDRNTASQRASCTGATELKARVAQATSATSVRVDQGRGYGELTVQIR